MSVYIYTHTRIDRLKNHHLKENIENKIHKECLSTISTSARTIISANETLFCIQPSIYGYKEIKKVRKVNLNTLF